MAIFAGAAALGGHHGEDAGVDEDAAKGCDPEEGEEKPEWWVKRGQGQAGADENEAKEGHLSIADSSGDGADGAVEEDHGQSHGGEDGAYLDDIVAVDGFHIDEKGALKDGEGDGIEEKEHTDQKDGAAAQLEPDGSGFEFSAVLLAYLGAGDGLDEDEIAEDGGQEVRDGGDDKGHAGAEDSGRAGLGHQANGGADGRAEGEPQGEADADDRHTFAALRPFGAIGDKGACGGDVGGTEADTKASQVEEGESADKGGEELESGGGGEGG